MASDSKTASDHASSKCPNCLSAGIMRIHTDARVQLDLQLIQREGVRLLRCNPVLHQCLREALHEGIHTGTALGS